MSALTRTTLATGLAGLLLLGAGSALLTRLPTTETIEEAPFVLTSGLGSPATLRTGTITATAVEASSTVADATGVAVSRDGVFLVVRLTWRADPKPAGVRAFRLAATDGRLFDDQGPLNSTCPTEQTGIPVRCAAVIEVPKDALEGAVLLVPADDGGAVAGDQELHIDLGIDAAAAARLAATTGRIELGTPVEGSQP